MSEDGSGNGWSPVNELKIVALKDIFIHEDVRGGRSEALVERLKRDQVQRDPIVVAPLARSSYKFVHLDGANRHTALGTLGYANVLVQVVDYRDSERVHLETWSHLVEWEETDLLRRLSGIPGVRVEATDLANHTTAGAFRSAAALCFVALRHGGAYVVTAEGNLVDRAQILRAICAAYPSEPKREPRDSHRHLRSHVASLFGQAGNSCYNVALIFPRFAAQDILNIARVGRTIPPGITRHNVFKRVLCVNLPLAALNGSSTIEDKNVWLQQYLGADPESGKPVKEPYRLFAESTVIFQSKCNCVCDLAQFGITDETS
jgi:hypothetical protein